MRWGIFLFVVAIVGSILYFGFLKDTIYADLLFVVVALLQGINSQIEYKEEKSKLIFISIFIFYAVAIFFTITFIAQLVS